jgi:hypothetical protein
MDKQDRFIYVEILNKAIPPQGIHHLDADWVFQQDNSGPHGSKYVTEWLQDHFPNFCQDWPPYSPDLNPMENMWSIVKDQVLLHHLQNLRQAITQVIKNLPHTTIVNIIQSMDRRLQSIIDLKGAHTKY